MSTLIDFIAQKDILQRKQAFKTVSTLERRKTF